MNIRMAKSITLALFGLITGICLTACSSQTQSTQGSLVDVAVTEIALMPFLMGQMASPDDPIPSSSNGQVSETAAIQQSDLPDGTNLIMNRIVNTELTIRFQERLIPPDLVGEAYQPLLLDPALDTPRKRAIRLGNALKTDLVMVGTVWWFRERGDLEQMPDNPASVGFELYLVDVKTGAPLMARALRRNPGGPDRRSARRGGASGHGIEMVVGQGAGPLWGEGGVAKAAPSIVSIQKWPIYPISALPEKFYPRNINHMHPKGTS